MRPLSLVLFIALVSSYVALAPVAAADKKTEMEAPDRLAAYSDVIQRLVAETIACSPENWTQGTLTMTTDGQYISYSLKNADELGKASISEELRTLIDELYVRMDSGGQSWSEATLRFDIEGDDVRYKTSFEYND